VINGDDVMRYDPRNDLLAGGVEADRYDFPDRPAPVRSLTSSTTLTIRIAGLGAGLGSFADLSGHISQLGLACVWTLGAGNAVSGVIVL
jgi:hypothetical protein